MFQKEEPIQGLSEDQLGGQCDCRLAKRKEGQGTWSERLWGKDVWGWPGHGKGLIAASFFFFKELSYFVVVVFVCFV